MAPGWRGFTIVRDEILDADTDFFRALVQHDRSRLGQLLAEDFLIVDVNAGNVTNRADFLAAFDAESVKFESIETRREDAIVREYSGAAVVIGTTAMRFRLPDGSTFSGRSRYTHVFTRSKSSWHLASAQGTALSPE